MQDDGVVIQPFWRSIYRHAKPTGKGAEAHAPLEHHHHKWWLDA